MVRGGGWEEEVVGLRKALLYDSKAATREEVSEVIVGRSNPNRLKSELFLEAEPEDLSQERLCERIARAA